MPAEYRKAWSFPSTRENSGLAQYTLIQETLRQAEGSGMSAYRLKLDSKQYVAVLGDHPGLALEQHIDIIMLDVEESELPDEVWQALELRREKMLRQDRWAEAHHRPGIAINKEGDDEEAPS